MSIVSDWMHPSISYHRLVLPSGGVGGDNLMPCCLLFFLFFGISAGDGVGVAGKGGAGSSGGCI